MNKTEDQVIEIIEDVVQHHMDWQDGERDTTNKSGGAVYSVDHLNAISNLTTQIANLGKEMSTIKEKLEDLPSQSKGRGMNPNFSTPNMPNGCIFCDNCGSYDHYANACNFNPSHDPNNNDGSRYNNEQVNAMSYDNGPRNDNNRYLPPNQRGNNYNQFSEVMTHNKMMETQISQLAGAIKDGVSTSKLPSQGIDPKNTVNAISTRSGKTLIGNDKVKSNESQPVTPPIIENIIESEEERTIEKDKIDEAPKEQEGVQAKEPDLLHRLPYPQKHVRHKLDAQFGKFLETLRQVHLSIPFTDAIKQMPNYARFMKDILSGRRNCDGVETVNLTEQCSAIIMNKMPPKLGDPGELLPTNISLQLADRSIKFPRGKVEDVPLRVGKFVIPVDFVVLDMDEDINIPIILGRPFLATSGALIDVKGAKISLKVGKEVLEFDLNKTMKYPCSNFDNGMMVDTVDSIVSDMRKELFYTNHDYELYENEENRDMEGRSLDDKGPKVKLKPSPTHLGKVPPVFVVPKEGARPIAKNKKGKLTSFSKENYGYG
ncbi:uncharacterized protein LOC110716789 [Chenopodium quinoa]|uniref:uncharacterized protein LOC110716789 n=1 Tax=Chenopodium quinoa TaxID=63459 RepID=UPI000B776DE7|nr:uncharacterized protein LOC110716789 [Chenopodium quinoa]